ncbi:hypothetical protein B0H19DRAFT_1100551 [Mycena capillaripes]|nr:hypothetical protein B0H19DRAFT_1100551 [Mycena capillaripes]
MGGGMMTPTGAHFLNMTPLATPTSPHFPAYVLAAPPPPPPPNGVNGMGGGAMMQAHHLGLGPPSALSPGAFWGRAGEGNVYGAPVGQPPHAHPQHSPHMHPRAHPHPHSPYGMYMGGGGGSPGLFGMHAVHAHAQMEEPKGYFDFPPAFGGVQGGGAGGEQGQGMVEKEIMREQEKEKEVPREVSKRHEERQKQVDGSATPGQDEADGIPKEEQEEDGQEQEQPAERARRHSSDPPPAPASPLREGKRPPPPPLRLPSTLSTGSG